MALIEVFSDSRQLARCTNCRWNVTWATEVSSGRRVKFTGDPVAYKTGREESTWRPTVFLDPEDLHRCERTFKELPMATTFSEGR